MSFSLSFASLSLPANLLFIKFAGCRFMSGSVLSAVLYPSSTSFKSLSLESPSCSSSPRMTLTSSLSEPSDASSESDEAFLAFFFEGSGWEVESVF